MSQTTCLIQVNSGFNNYIWISSDKHRNIYSRSSEIKEVGK